MSAVFSCASQPAGFHLSDNRCRVDGEHVFMLRLTAGFYRHTFTCFRCVKLFVLHNFLFACLIRVFRV